MTLPEGDARGPSDSPPAKRLKLSDDDSIQQQINTGSSLHCCDDALLLNIFSYLKPTDLLALSQCCERLRRVVSDHTLWAHVDFRPVRLSQGELNKYVEFFKDSTKVIACKGPWIPPAPSDERFRSWVAGRTPCRDSEPSITLSVLENIFTAAPNLTTLILENHILDSQDICWEMFPSRLEHLSLRSCYIDNINPEKSFFHGIDLKVPRLKILDVSYCLWFKSHSFLALSKCPQLEELRMADCLLGNFVPYVSLSARFGFNSLTVVDFRRTWVSDREVSCLNKTTSLRELYLEAPVDEEGAALVSDLAVTAFGGSLDDWRNIGYCVIIVDRYQGFKPSMLRVITVRNYSAVTDMSLRHSASCLRYLQRLDVTGTACTQDGVLTFKSQRPEVQIESDFDLDVNPSSNVDNT